MGEVFVPCWNHPLNLVGSLLTFQEVRQAGLDDIEHHGNGNGRAGGSSQKSGDGFVCVGNDLRSVVDDTCGSIFLLDCLHSDARIDQSPVLISGIRIKASKYFHAGGHALRTLLNQISHQWQVAELCRDQRPGCVFIDLGVPDLDITAAVAQLRSAAEAVPTVAYGSHVDKDRLDAARAAGCDEVLPRSRFSSELPAWLRRYLDTAEQV